MTNPDQDIPIPELTENGPDHSRRLEGLLARRIMTEIEEAAAEVRADGMTRTVVIRAPGGEEVRYEVNEDVADDVEREEWAGYGTNWVQENARRLVENTGVDLSGVEEDDVTIFHVGIVKPPTEKEAGAASERVA